MSPKQRWLTVAATLLAAVAFATLSHLRLSHAAGTVRVNDVVFGADTLENLNGLLAGKYGIVDPRKHALAQIVFAVLTAPQRWLGISPLGSAINTMALLAGLLAASFVVLCIRIGASLPLALASCLFLFSTNAVSFQTALFETHVLTALSTVLAILLFLELANRVVDRPIGCAVLAGIAAGIAGLANTPAAASALVYASLAWGRLEGRPRFTRAWLSAGVPCAIALSLALSPSVARDFGHHAAPLQWAAQYTNHWADIGNFTNGSLSADYWATNAFLSWVSIGVEPTCRYIASDVLRLWHLPLALFAVVGCLALVAYAARRITRDRGATPLAVGLMIVCGVYLAFYWYFNAWEAMLYSSQWMLLLIGFIVLGAKGTRWAALGVLAVGLAMFVSNEPLRWPARETYAAACPPDHFPPWGQAASTLSPSAP
ncbi:MAG TPA: hypothetical protein VLM79_40940 [Kofleriaceae bacterium]|nr:hypothetical protein [Kofleriaceae bacterium]